MLDAGIYDLTTPPRSLKGPPPPPHEAEALMALVILLLQITDFKTCPAAPLWLVTVLQVIVYAG